MDFEYEPNFDVDMCYDFEEAAPEPYEALPPPVAPIARPPPPNVTFSMKIPTLTEIPPIPNYKPESSDKEPRKIAEDKRTGPVFPTLEAPPSTANDSTLSIEILDVRPAPPPTSIPDRLPTLAEEEPKKAPGDKKKKVEALPPPVTPAARPPPLNGAFSMKILKTSQITPMPNYKTMLDEELNDHLDKYGLRPMGRKRAIEELTRIYEATHPIIDDKVTPTRERIWCTVSKVTEKPAKKQQPRKRPAEPEAPSTETNTAAGSPTKASKNQTRTLEQMTGDILAWFRLPQNADLYVECLALKSIPIERLLETFGPLLRERSISKDVFLRILDHLHVTYSDKRDENNHYYY